MEGIPWNKNYLNIGVHKYKKRHEMLEKLKLQF